VPVAALGVLGGMALVASSEPGLPRLLAGLLALLPSGRALWVLLPGLGGADALGFVDGRWSVGIRGRWLSAECIGKVEVHQVGWWLVFRCADGRRWVWLEMHGADPGLRRGMARALRSAADPWATATRRTPGG